MTVGTDTILAFRGEVNGLNAAFAELGVAVLSPEGLFFNRRRHVL